MSDPTRTFETLTVAVDADGVALLTLDRPDALNSFTVTMARELEEFFRSAATDERRHEADEQPDPDGGEHARADGDDQRPVEPRAEPGQPPSHAVPKTRRTSATP